MKKLLIIITILFPLNSFAAQIIDIIPDTQKRIILSKNNINRISLVNDVIESFQANKGELIVTQNNKTKDLYLRTNSNNNKVISLFLVTKKGFTYKLNIAPRYGTSKTIILNNPNIHSENIANKNDSYKQQIITLLKNFHNNKAVQNYKFTSDFKPKAKIKYKDFKVRSLGALIANNYNHKSHHKYQIEKYLITNKTSQIKEVTEQEFYKTGYVAIMLDEKSILPKRSTALYLVKSIN